MPDKRKAQARGSVSLVSEPFGLGVAKAVRRNQRAALGLPAQVRLSSREQQPRPPAIVPKKGRKR
jgi:hypothetical protein